MTPEEKAKELVEKFYEYSQDVGRVRYNSKQCAIICVDEIIESLQKYGTLIDGEDPIWIEPDTEYWQQVKAEIEKL